MKKVFKSWKVTVLIVLAVVIAAGSVFYFWKKADGNKPIVVIEEVVKGDVYKPFSISSPVESSDKSFFQAIDGVKVLEVNVKVGDIVHAGDLLATFDVSGLNEGYQDMLAEARNAKTRYDEAVVASGVAIKSLPEIDRQIMEMENRINSGGGGNGGSSSSQGQSSSGVMKYLGGLLGDSDLGNLISSLADSGISLSDLSKMISGMSGGAESLAGMDMTSILGSLGGILDDDTALFMLQMQKVTLENQASTSYVKGLKEASEAAALAAENYKINMDKMAAGWKAEKYGIVSDVNITAGQVYKALASSGGAGSFDLSTILSMFTGGEDINTLLSQIMGSGGQTTQSLNIGILVHNYENFLVTFSIGKYEKESVKIGQKAIITLLDYEYEGEVTFIGAIAAGSGGIDSSIMDSLFSSGSTSSGSVTGTVTITNPDENLTVGFVVEVDIIVDEVKDVLLVPVESVRPIDRDRERLCVFIYNPNTKRIERRPVVTGLLGRTQCQIVEGVNEGEKVVRTYTGAPKFFEDGAKVKLKPE